MKIQRNRFQKEVFPKIKQMLRNEDESNVMIGLSFLRQFNYKDVLAFAKYYVDYTKYNNTVYYDGHVFFELILRPDMVVFIFHGDDYIDLWSTTAPHIFKASDKKYKIVFWTKTIGRNKQWMKQRVKLLQEGIDFFTTKIQIYKQHTDEL